MFKKGYKQSEEHKRKIGLANKIVIKEYFSTKKGKIQAKQHSIKMLGRKLTEEHKQKIRREGLQHGLWKGERAGYTAKHDWVRRKLGVPKYCEHCKRTDKKKYEWANVDHKYRRRAEDYIRLCTACHRKYDYRNHLSNMGHRGGTKINKLDSN